MAKMYGKLRKMGYGQCKYGCCYMPTSKTTIKREETERVLKEAQEEIEEELDLKHSRGLCYDPYSKMYGCDYCYNNDDYYDASELDGIPGVWTDAERLIP